MISFYTKYIYNICRSFEFDSIAQNSKNIVFINGSFGTGKSNLVRKIEKELAARKIVDAVVKFDEAENISFLTEFMKKASNYFYFVEDEQEQTQPFFSETDSNLRRYYDLLNRLNDSNPDLASAYFKDNVLRAYSDEEGKKDDSASHSQLQEGIEKIFSKKGERILLLENPKIVAESLIVDLMNCFFSGILNKTEDIDLKEIHKKKIVFIIDNYESIFGSVNRWLAEFFFVYCYNLNFAKFIYYKIEIINPQAKVSDFFDFRFIISSRENLSEFIPEYFSAYSEMSEIYRLEPMTEAQLGNFLEAHGIETANYLKDVYEISSGIPALINYTFDILSQYQEDFNSSLVYLFAYENILKHKTEEQKEWIKCAAFLNEIEANALRCFPSISHNYKRAYNYLNKSTEISTKSKNSNTLKLNKAIKKYISYAVQDNFPEQADFYTNIANSYNSIKSFINQFNDVEIEILRELAYFKSFMVSVLINHCFAENLNLVKSILEKYSEMFSINNNIYKPKQTFSIKFDKFNRLIEPNLYEQKIKKIQDYWKDYSNSVSAKNSNLEKKQNDLLEKLNKEQIKHSENEQIISDSLDSLSNLKDELKKHKEKLKKFNTTKLKKIAVFSILIAVFSVIFKVASTEVFFDSNQINTLSTISSFCNFLSVAFSLLCLLLLIRIFIINSNKKDISFLNIKISGLETEISNLKYLIARKKEENDSLRESISESEKQIIKIREEILESKELIGEPFA